MWIMLPYFTGKLRDTSIQRLSSGKARVDLMPVFDALLAVLPAQIDFVVLAPGREVHQTGIEVLQYRARVLDLMDKLIKPFETARQQTGCLAAAVPGRLFDHRPGLR